MDRADLLDRVQKLIALALHNPHEQEARSAALKACQLIEEHGLLTVPPAPVPMVPRTPRKTSVWSGIDWAADELRWRWQAQQDARRWYDEAFIRHGYTDPFKPPE